MLYSQDDGFVSLKTSTIVPFLLYMRMQDTRKTPITTDLESVHSLRIVCFRGLMIQCVCL